MWIWITAIVLVELMMLVAWFLMDRDQWKLKDGRPERRTHAVPDRNSSDPTLDTQTTQSNRTK